MAHWEKRPIGEVTEEMFDELMNVHFKECIS